MFEFASGTPPATPRQYTPHALLAGLVEPPLAATLRGHSHTRLTRPQSPGPDTSVPPPMPFGDYLAANRFTALQDALPQSYSVAVRSSVEGVRGFDPFGSELRAARRPSEVARLQSDGTWLIDR